MRAWLQRRLAPTRPLAAVPRPVAVLLALALAAQLAWHAAEPPPAARTQELPPPPPVPVLRLAALGEPATLAAGATLWLQYFDDQPGRSIPYRELDYARVRAWLETLLALEPDAGYPLLLAVRLYGQVNDPPRQRVMLDLAADAFVERPLERWRWLAEAAIIARHRLGDLELALDYAQRIAAHTEPGQIPHWARDLRILVLEDMGELEAARVLIGGLLASGEITDPHEIRFLERRLEALERRSDDRTDD